MRPVRFHLLFFTLACLLLASCHPSTRPPVNPASNERPVLLLVSIDGFRADYLERDLTPRLAALAAQGVRAKAMRPAFPSLTFPNHYTLVTGLVPDHHGLVNNVMLDPNIPGEHFSMRNRVAVENAAWWNGGQPLWNTAHAAGLRTATMFWPGSEAPVRGQQPDYWFVFDADRSPRQRVQQVLDWLDLPAVERPHFITLYFDAVDHEGHVHGPDSDELKQALVDTDAVLGQLLDGLQQRGLWQKINLVVVSDHGMAEMPKGQFVILDDYVAPDVFELIAGGPLAGIEAKPGREIELDTALANADMTHAQCWRKDQVPARYRYGSHPRIPRWICMADEGWTFVPKAMLDKTWAREPNRGAHGFDPALDSMAALFVAHGPDFQQGLVVPGFDSVDVYPLLARLLGIEPEVNDGNPDATLPLLRTTPNRD